MKALLISVGFPREVKSGMFGENLTTEGLGEESVHIGDAKLSVNRSMPFAGITARIGISAPSRSRVSVARFSSPVTIN